MKQVNIVAANMVTVALESLLYGVFLILSGTYFYLHHQRVTNVALAGPSRSQAYFSLAFLGALGVSMTVSAHWILTVTRFFDAFINFEGGAAPTLFYSDLAQTTEVIKTAFLIATIVMSDLMFVYRLWVVWGYNYYIIVLPSLTVLGLCVSGTGIVYELSQLSIGNTVFVSQAARWITADYSFTFATNIYSSTLIAWRVWRASQASGPYGGGNLRRLLVTVVESAGLYTIYVVFFFAFYEATSNLQYTFVDTLCQIGGIAFMMINVRVALGWAQKAGATTSVSAHSTAFSRRNGENSYIMRPVAVDITRIVHKEDDMGQPVKRLSSELSMPV
ncbi:uncharacterized protein FIBRA_02286 [Fibroporia radiculosa]|uniref:Uncharacterized protein n=1 Tax=Fibroporia radiculosa TaxID=599839 RepID=J4I8Z2_9APHY|nr:uncharacterized protein FIBRA_02286 [Fibroporia radiculosa]CCM00256.1 predicted protein [Fibroporia radiculosa]